VPDCGCSRGFAPNRHGCEYQAPRVSRASREYPVCGAADVEVSTSDIVAPTDLNVSTDYAVQPRWMRVPSHSCNPGIGECRGDGVTGGFAPNRVHGEYRLSGVSRKIG
jgi:hypothetical protein